MADNSSGMVAEIKRRSLLVDVVIRLVKEKPLGAVGAAITLILLFTGIFADLLAPYGMNESTDKLLFPPFGEFWLGTDNIGRDVLSRVIFGARVSVIVGLAGSTIATSLNLIIGILSGYIGGIFDLVVQRFVDALMSIPGLMFLLFLITITGPGMVPVILVLGIRWGIVGSRTIRGAVLGIKSNVYVEAAEAIGCSTARILTRHILPNIMAPTIILFSVTVPAVILTEATLSFLGFGIPPPMPSWGSMISGTGRTYMFVAPWMVIWPGLALAIVVFGVNMLGDALRDLLDPRLRGGAGRYGVRAKKKSP